MYAIVKNNSVRGIRSNNSGSLADGESWLPAYDSGSFDPETQTRKFKRYDIVSGSVYVVFDFFSKTADEIYKDKLDAGYLDTETGIKLKTTQSAQAEFSQTMVLMNMLPDGTYSIWDYNDAELKLPKADIVALLGRYGTFCYQLFCDYAP